MTTEALQTLLSGDYKKVVTEIQALTDLTQIEVHLKQLNPAQHDVFDKSKRKDKAIKDNEGRDQVQPVARIALALQKLIVKRAAAFLCGNPIKINATVVEDSIEETLLKAIEKTWDDNKLDYKSKNIAKKMMGETSAAELWYVAEASEGEWDELNIGKVTNKLRMTILSSSQGDDLYPVFSDTGDMIAFGRGYKLRNDEGKDVEHFDLYTEDTIYKGEKGQTEWVVIPEPNVFKKIPIVYYSQEEPEWADVQSMIDRLEVLISNNADTNDYFGSPMIVVDGEIVGFAKKGETGKMLETKNGAKVSYLTWDQAPEAVKNEIDNLLRFIYTFTDTPDISFEQMKSIGGNAPSGFALKMLFLGAHLKAADKEEIFGECIQRRLNFLKSALIGIAPKLAKGSTLYMKPKFEYFLPKNDGEKIDILNSAVSGGILSIESAVYQNPLVTDPEAELALIQNGKIDQEFNN